MVRVIRQVLEVHATIELSVASNTRRVARQLDEQLLGPPHETVRIKPKGRIPLHGPLCCAACADITIVVSHHKTHAYMCELRTAFAMNYFLSNLINLLW